MIGQKLGSYELLEEIGKGGMATVYRAHQVSIKRDVAIKLIRKNIADTPEAVHRFQREAQLIAQLEHPHILPVYDFDGRHDPPYIVMRYLVGGTLKEVMAQGLLPLPEVVYLMQQVCGAVDYANRQGIMHRDLKPSNILVDREGNAFVMDFGIARMAGGQDGKGITETGAIIGTPDYMSPEQAMGSEDIDHRTDVYALGVMLFEMLTGQLPFEASTSMGTLMMHIQDPIPSAFEFNMELPDEVDELIERVLAKAPEDRFESAAELSTALLELIGHGVTQSPNQLRHAAGTSLLQRVDVGDKDKSTGSTTGSSEQNRTVTAVYASADEYSLLVDEVAGNEAAVRSLQALMREFETVIQNYTGETFLQTDTDILALWGANSVGENDAEQAIRCALAMKEKLKILGAAFLDGEDEDEPLPLNIGIHSGMVLLKPTEGTGTYSATGATISIANRLKEQADGTILVTHDTFRQVMGIFDMLEDRPLKIRGRKDRIPTYLVQYAKDRAFHIQARGIEGLETQMVGRDSELKLLQQAYMDAFEDEETQVITVMSDAGLGKSRLLYEFDKWAELREETYRIFNGRATASMKDRPYALIRDMISFRFNIQDSDALDVVQDKLEAGIQELLKRDDSEMAHMIGYLCGFELVESPHIKGLLGDGAQIMRRGKQLFLRMFAQLCEIQPVMVTLEDMHHADEASLDLLNELFEADDERQLMAICNARPNLLERRPTWGSGQEFHRQITLEPLTKRDSRDLVKELLQKVEKVPKELRDLLVERSEGNPFYMEELVMMLIDERVIQRLSDEEWSVEIERLESLSVPKTLNGLLESRLDTLLQPEKLTLQRASVIGRVFYDDALRKIDSIDETSVSNLEAVLEKLAERQFIHKREISAFEGVTEYIFASNMLHDAILNALLERQIATYNRGAAEWLVEVAGDRQEEYGGLIADYYERAGEATRAMEYLLQAGKASLDKGATREAQRAFNRALTLLPADDESTRSLHAENLIYLSITLFTLGETKLAHDYAQQGLKLARELDDKTLQARGLYQLSRLAERAADNSSAKQLLDEALPLAQADIDLQIQIMSRQAWSQIFHQSQPEAAQEIAEQMLKLASQHKVSLREQASIYNLFSIVYQFIDPPQLDEAQAMLEKSLALTREIGDKDGIGVALGNLGEIAREREEFQKARDYNLEALALARETERQDNIAISLTNLCLVEMALANPEPIPGYLTEALQISQAIDDIQGQLFCVLAMSGYALLTGDVERGLALFGVVETHPATDENMRFDMRTVLALVPENMAQADIDADMAKGNDLDFDAVIQAWLDAHSE